MKKHNMARTYSEIKTRIEQGKTITKADYEVLDKIIEDYQKEINKNAFNINGDIRYALYMKDEQTKIVELADKARVKD